MKITHLAASLALLAAAPALAVDHNNVDAHRPLSFDDAESIAFREQALEFGLHGSFPRRGKLTGSMEAEFLYGFAMNSHLSLGFDHPFGGSTDADEHFDGRGGGRGPIGGLHVGGRSSGGRTGPRRSDFALGLFHNFNRETERRPAFSVRADAFVPVSSGAKGIGFRVRGIASRRAGQYGRLHLNLDVTGNPGAARGEREFRPGMVLGFTHPIGYPRRFDTTGLAEISVQQGTESGSGPVLSAGIGVRRQVGVRSVLDLGIQSDLATWNGSTGDRIRLVAGYSYGF